MFSIRYSIFDRYDRVVCKESTFKTEEARAKFFDKIGKQYNFARLDAFSDEA